MLGVPILTSQAAHAAAVATGAVFAGAKPGSYVASLVVDQVLTGAQLECQLKGRAGAGARFSAAELGLMAHRCLRIARALRRYRTDPHRTDPLERAAARAGARLAVKVGRLAIAAAMIEGEGSPS